MSHAPPPSPRTHVIARRCALAAGVVTLHGLAELIALRRGTDPAVVAALSVGFTAFLLAALIARAASVTGRTEERLRDQLSARERMEEALRESEERVRLATSAARVGLWSWDIRSDRSEWTPLCKELFGIPADREMTNAIFLDAVHLDDREHMQRAGTRALAEGAEYDVELRVVLPDGGERWIVARGRAFHGAGGRPKRMMGAVIDVTERKLAAEAAERSRERLLATERAARAEVERVASLKDEFLATISHELRTPLTAILGWAQILHDRPEAAPVRRQLETILRNAKLQAQLVEDLLDMSRIVSGHLRLDVRPADPALAVNAAVETVRPAAEAKGVHVVVQAPCGAELMALDPDRLQQIVWNLVSNAVKFTPEGGRVDVSVTCGRPGVEICVADTGKGIDPEFAPHIFERFRQEDASSTRRHGGLGLGLSIVKELVELHGGTVRAASDGPGKGATFTVAIPALDAGAVAEPSRPDSQSAFM